MKKRILSVLLAFMLVAVGTIGTTGIGVTATQICQTGKILL